MLALTKKLCPERVRVSLKYFLCDLSETVQYYAYLKGKLLLISFQSS